MADWNALPVDWQAARAALERRAGAFATLVDGADLGGRIAGMQWTADDVVAHLVAQATSFGAFATGERVADDDLLPGEAAMPAAHRIARVNDRLIARERGRGVTDAVGQFLDMTARCGGDHPLHSWEGLLDVANSTALLVSEFAVHGFDVARSLQRPWRIAGTDAAIALTVGANLMPRFADPRRVAGMDATFAVQSRPGPHVAVHVRDGTLTVDEGRPDRADCRIRADATALLLVAYRRRSIAWAVSRGAVVAYGRRPWLGLRFTSLIDQP